MLVIHPQSVNFGTVRIENVTAVALTRHAVRATLELTDDAGGGPYHVFADVPEQRVTAVVRQTLSREDALDIKPGTQATLVVFTAPAASDASRRKLSATAVVIDVSAELKAGATPAALRTITFALVSADGATDPVSVVDAKGES